MGVAPGATYPLQSREADRLELTHPGKGMRPDARLLAVLQDFQADFDETTVDTTFRFGRPVATTTNEAADRVNTRSWSVQPVLTFAPLRGLRLSAELRRDETVGPRTTDVTVRNASGSVTSATTIYSESVPPAWRNSWAVSGYLVPVERPFRLEAGVRYDELDSHADSTATSSTSTLDVTDHRVTGEGGVSKALGPIEPYVHVASGFRAPNLDDRYFNGYIHGGLRLFVVG